MRSRPSYSPRSPRCSLRASRVSSSFCTNSGARARRSARSSWRRSSRRRTVRVGKGRLAIRFSEDSEQLRGFLLYYQLRPSQHLTKDFCGKPSKKMGEFCGNDSRRGLESAQIDTDGHQLQSVLHEFSIGGIITQCLAYCFEGLCILS